MNLGEEIHCMVCNRKQAYCNTAVTQLLGKPCNGARCRAKAAAARQAETNKQNNDQLKQKRFKPLFMGKAVGSSAEAVAEGASARQGPRAQGQTTLLFPSISSGENPQDVDSGPLKPEQNAES